MARTSRCRHRTSNGPWGPEVDQVAAQAGVSHQEAADGIAEVLPQAVDKLTPEGKMPDMGSLGDMLGKFLGSGSR